MQIAEKLPKNFLDGTNKNDFSFFVTSQIKYGRFNQDKEEFCILKNITSNNDEILLNYSFVVKSKGSNNSKYFKNNEFIHNETFGLINIDMRYKSDFLHKLSDHMYYMNKDFSNIFNNFYVETKKAIHPNNVKTIEKGLNLALKHISLFYHNNGAEHFFSKMEKRRAKRQIQKFYVKK